MKKIYISMYNPGKGKILVEKRGLGRLALNRKKREFLSLPDPHSLKPGIQRVPTCSIYFQQIKEQWRVPYRSKSGTKLGS